MAKTVVWESDVGVGEDTMEGDSSAAGGSALEALLARVRAGEEAAAQELFELLYEELHRTACSLMARERPGHTLRPTELVAEAYVRLFDGNVADFHDQEHVMAVTATAMRRVLTDRWRAKQALKRKPTGKPVPIDDVLDEVAARHLDLSALDEALELLARRDPNLVRLVELRFYAGLTVDQTATALGVSRRSVERDWTVARAWLKDRLS